MRVVPIFVAALLAACACDDTQTRNEAMLFIDRIEDFDIDDPIEERRAAIDSIREMALTDEAVIAARDRCVTAYGSLIEAEDQTAIARHLLVGLMLPDGGELPASPDVEAQMNAALDHSNEALARSSAAVPRCVRAVSDLERRFPRRRATQ